MKKYLMIAAIAIFTTCSWEIQAQQSPFTERLAFYYNDTTWNRTEMYYQITHDSIILNHGNYPELIQYLSSPDSLYTDTMLSYSLIRFVNQYRRVAYLTNKEKNEMLLFLSTILLGDKFLHYPVKDYLFNRELWSKNDSIQYNTALINNLQYLIKHKPQQIVSWAGRRFSAAHIEILLPDIIEYIIKPAFVDSIYTGFTNNVIWEHIFCLTEAHSKEILPYLYRATAESTQECVYFDLYNKYESMSELLYNKNIDIQIKKQIWLHLLNDACIYILNEPTIMRNQPLVKLFESLILRHLENYPSFPLKEVKKLSVPQQVEFVRNWINENL